MLHTIIIPSLFFLLTALHIIHQLILTNAIFFLPSHTLFGLLDNLRKRESSEAPKLEWSFPLPFMGKQILESCESTDDAATYYHMEREKRGGRPYTNHFQLGEHWQRGGLTFGRGLYLERGDWDRPYTHTLLSSSRRWGERDRGFHMYFLVHVREWLAPAEERMIGSYAIVSISPPGELEAPWASIPIAKLLRKPIISDDIFVLMTL